jgi:hypothetical protein
MRRPCSVRTSTGTCVSRGHPAPHPCAAALALPLPPRPSITSKTIISPRKVWRLPQNWGDISPQVVGTYHPCVHFRHTSFTSRCTRRVCSTLCHSAGMPYGADVPDGGVRATSLQHAGWCVSDGDSAERTVTCDQTCFCHRKCSAGRNWCHIQGKQRLLIPVHCLCARWAKALAVRFWHPAVENQDLIHRPTCRGVGSPSNHLSASTARGRLKRNRRPEAGGNPRTRKAGTAQLEHTLQPCALRWSF